MRVVPCLATFCLKTKRANTPRVEFGLIDGVMGNDVAVTIHPTVLLIGSCGSIYTKHRHGPEPDYITKAEIADGIKE